MLPEDPHEARNEREHRKGAPVTNPSTVMRLVERGGNGEHDTDVSGTVVEPTRQDGNIEVHRRLGAVDGDRWILGPPVYAHET